MSETAAATEPALPERPLPDAVRELYPFASHYFQIGDHRMHYIDEGEGEVVLMLHGNPTWSFFYRDLVSGLRENFRCVALDHLGCGLSDKPQDYPYCLSAHVANLTSFIDHMGWKKVNLVVHDWGGAIGMGFAVHHPERVGKLVVMNTAAFPSKRMPLRIRACRFPLLGKLLVRGFNGFAGPATFMAVNRRRLPKAVKAGFLFPYNNWRNRVAVDRFVKDIPMGPSHPSYGDLLAIEDGLARLVNHPMLIAWGARDFCFDDTFLDEWKTRFPSATVYREPHAGHYLLEDAGEIFIPRIRAFLMQ